MANSGKKTACGVVTSGACWGANCVLWGACPMGKALEETKKEEAENEVHHS